MKINQILKATTLALLMSLSIAAVHSQDRNVAVSNISRIAVSSGIDLYLTQGTTESLVIKGDADLIKDVIIEQKEGRVLIKYKEGVNWGRLFHNESIKVEVTFKNITALTASGGSDVYAKNNITANALNVTASGGSDISLTLSCKDLQVSASGGSDVKLKGTGENMILVASGGSDVDAYGFVVNYAKATTSGGSDANLYVNKGLEASANGGSDIHYKGNAALKKISNSKSSDINHVK